MKVIRSALVTWIRPLRQPWEHHILDHSNATAHIALCGARKLRSWSDLGHPAFHYACAGCVAAFFEARGCYAPCRKRFVSGVHVKLRRAGRALCGARIDVTVSKAVPLRSPCKRCFHAMWRDMLRKIRRFPTARNIRRCVTMRQAIHSFLADGRKRSFGDVHAACGMLYIGRGGSTIGSPSAISGALSALYRLGVIQRESWVSGAFRYWRNDVA